MQQTEKRGFNIIETSDAFSPQALNDNTHKLEEVLDEHEAAVAGEVAAVAGRVVNLEKFHYAAKAYYGDGINGSFFDLGFTPSVVFLWGHYLERFNMLVEGFAYESEFAKIVPGGFTLLRTDFDSFNAHGYFYAYAAFGLDE